MKSQKEWHVINGRGEHITIPYNEHNEANQSNEKYHLDVEWYRKNGYKTLSDHDNRIKQIEKYYSENPGVLKEGETIEYISKNTKCIVTNMSLEEYVMSTGDKTYEEIKKELGL